MCARRGSRCLSRSAGSLWRNSFPPPITRTILLAGWKECSASSAISSLPSMAGNPRDPARLPRIDMGGCRLEAAFEGRSLGDSSRAVAMIWPSSAITAYEVALQIVSGRSPGDGLGENSVLRFLEGGKMGPINPEIGALGARVPEDYARDPADRLS